MDTKASFNPRMGNLRPTLGREVLLMPHNLMRETVFDLASQLLLDALTHCFIVEAAHEEDDTTWGRDSGNSESRLRSSKRGLVVRSRGRWSY